MTNRGYNEDLDAYGIMRRYSVIGERPRHSFGVVCSGCQKEEFTYYGVEPPPEQMAKRFRNMGWDISGKKNRCPVCIARDKEQKSERKIIMEGQKVNMRLLKQVMDELEDSYDQKLSRYKPGFSDEGVAVKLRVAPNFVAEARRQLYGEIKVDPEMDKLREELSAMLTMGNELLGRINKFISKGHGGH